MSAPRKLDSNFAYFFLTSLKYAAISRRALTSRPVSSSVPLSISTTVSVGLWEVPIDMDEITVSSVSAPASAAFNSVATESPVVAWV